MNQIQDNEIDFFELFQTLWGGKWVISTFVTIAILLGSSFIFLKDTIYASKLTYTIDTIPPFYEEKKVYSDFQKKFYSISIFEDWKKNYGKTVLVFDDFSTIEIFNGYAISKSEDQQLATLVSENEERFFLLVKSNQLPILNDFFKYAQYINKLLKKEYVIRSREELKIIESRFKDLKSANSDVVELVLSIDRYIVSADKGANVLKIQHPKMPKKISPNVPLIFALSLILGGLVGVFFILARNAIKRRK